MAITSLSGTQSGTRHLIYGFYKEALKIAQSSTDSTISTNTSLTSVVNSYNNLTVSNGFTLTLGTNTGDLCFLFVNNLVLNGTISANTIGSVTSGLGGAGNAGVSGGNLLIFAKQISGTGSITALGTAGTNASSPTGTYTGQTSLTTPYWLSTSYSGNGTMSSNGVNGNGKKGTKPTTTIATNTFPLSFPYWLTAIQENYLIISGAGSTGSSSNSLNYGHGGGGGASIISSGGDGGNTNTTGTFAGGGGGGGGGFIYLVSETSIPGITINVSGSNGGNGFGASGGGGGGGAGGLISVLAPANSSTMTVTSGSGGTGGPAGSSGSAGLSIFQKVNFL